MKVIWYIYGDIFATYPNLTIGTAVGGVLTPIPWNTPTEANGQHHASASNPLGMTTRDGDPGITQTWQDKRVIDFGDYDDPTNDPANPSSWYGDDIYIDDVDNPIGDTQDFTVRVIGNGGQTAIMRLNNANGTNWFSANPNHFQYTNNYGNTDDALNMARLLNGGTNNVSTGIQQNWHARNTNPQNWKEFVVYKVIMNSITSRNTSVFISNTTGTGQTIAQRFPGAIEYDADNADHVASGTISGPTTTCERTTGESTTGFQTTGILPPPFDNFATDIGGAYVAGVTVIDVPNDAPNNRHQFTKSTPYADVGFHSIFRDDETMTGFKSENWTDYHAYGAAREDLTPYYNAGNVWGVPAGNGNQPWPPPQQVPVDLGYSLNMFRMFHGENAGMTADANARPYGSDLNMIIPDPAGGGGAGEGLDVTLNSLTVSDPDDCTGQQAPGEFWSGNATSGLSVNNGHAGCSNANPTGGRITIRDATNDEWNAGIVIPSDGDSNGCVFGGTQNDLTDGQMNVLVSDPPGSANGWGAAGYTVNPCGVNQMADGHVTLARHTTFCYDFIPNNNPNSGSRVTVYFTNNAESIDPPNTIADFRRNINPGGFGISSSWQLSGPQTWVPDCTQTLGHRNHRSLWIDNQTQGRNTANVQIVHGDPANEFRDTTITFFGFGNNAWELRRYVYSYSVDVHAINQWVFRAGAPISVWRGEGVHWIYKCGNLTTYEDGSTDEAINLDNQSQWTETVSMRCS